MKQIKASEIEANMIIVDQLNENIVVTEVWPSQGEGLGIVVKGKRIEDGGPSHNRYYDPDYSVSQIVRDSRG